MKGEFLSTVSHELRTPLTAIRGALGLLGGGVLGALPAPALDYVRIATAGTERLARLLNDILDFAKIESGQFVLEQKLIDTEQLATSALELAQTQAASSGAQVELDVRARCQVRADQDRIVQVLLNLISNAAKFSPANARNRLGIAATASGRVRFSVADSGPGVAEADVPKLFTRFQQLDASDSRARGGTGLGLALCKALVEAHGGQIGVDTAPGRGSTFWFELDRHE